MAEWGFPGHGWSGPARTESPDGSRSLGGIAALPRRELDELHEMAKKKEQLTTGASQQKA